MSDKEYENIASQLRAKSLQVSQRMGLSADDADDVAQEVLLKLWLMRAELDESHPVEALVVVATKNRAIDMFRTKTHLSDIPDLELMTLAGGSLPTDEIEYAETLSWLQEKMHSLPDKERAVLMMRQVEKREYSEIATLLGIEETSARVLLARARKKLLQQFKQYSK